MTKEETYDTHVYVEGRQRPLPVGMYTDEHSEICSIRFGNSFTLNVVSPQDLITLAQELETFGQRAMELHYGDDSSRMRAMSEEMTRLQEKLEGAGVIEPVDRDAEDDFVQAGIDAREQQKAARMMKGTVSAGDWKDPSDPVNW